MIVSLLKAWIFGHYKKYGRAYNLYEAKKIEFQLFGLIETGSNLHNQMPRLLDNSGKK